MYVYFLLGALWVAGAVSQAAETPILDVGNAREMGVKEIGAGQRHGLGFADEGRFVVAGDVWTLAVALEMATFKKTVNRLSVQAKQMASLARNFSQVATGSDYRLSDIEAEYVGTVSALLDAELDTIDADLASARHYLESVEMATQAGRVRRAWIPIIGEALQTVFGTATQRDMKRVQGELAHLKVQQRELGHVVESQLSLLNTTFLDQSKVSKQLDQLARANKLMAEEARALLNRTQELAREEDRDHLLDILGARLRVVHATLGRLRADLDRFLTGWTAAAQHHLSPALLPPKDFLDALQGIQAKLPGGSTLLFPADDYNLGAHYASCRVTVTRISGGLLLFVDLPVTRPDMTFNLLRAVPLPVAVGNDGVFAMVAPEVPYLAVSLDQKHSIEMDQADLAGCQEGTVRICNPQHPLRYAGNGNEGDCLLSLYRGEAEKAKAACQVVLVKSPAPTLYRAKGTTTWLFSVATTEVVTAHCQVDPSSTPRPVHISGVGTLTLPPGCGASIGGMLLSAPAHFVSAYHEAQVDSFVMPRLPAPTLANFTLPLEGVREDTLRKVDGLLNSTWGLDPVAASGTALKLQDLRDRVKAYETAAAEETTTTIHYVASMGASGIVLVVVAILVAYYCCCARAAICLGSCCLQGPAWAPLATPLQTAPWTPPPAPPTTQVVYVAREQQPATATLPF